MFIKHWKQQKASLGNKTVNGKALNITAVDVLNNDEEGGTLRWKSNR